MLSFSGSAKAEVCKEYPQSGCCALAECFGILLFCNSFSEDCIKIITESQDFARLLPKLFRKAFGLSFDSCPEEGSIGKQVFAIRSKEKITKIMESFGFSPEDTLSLHINLPVVEEDCCKASFLRGAFLTGGSVTSPAKSYHMELASTHQSVVRECDALIRDIFSAWEGDTRQPMLDDMAWLYLENAAYRLELPRRPVLEALRFAHADYFFAIQYKLSRQEWMAKNQLVYTMQAARWRKVLGRTAPVMTPYESSLAAALAPENIPEPALLKKDLLALFAKFALFDGKVRQKPALHLRLQGFWAKLATKAMPTQMIKTDRVTVEHSGAVDAAGSGLAVDKRRANITLRQRAAQDRAYIESCFGRCFYPPEQLRKAEQELCTGVHLGCHLWFSAGVPSPAQAPTPEARQLAQQAELQAERNRAYYAKNQELHRSVVLRLTEQIRNCILVHQQPDQRIARSGDLCAGRVWRAPYLNDDRVFLCPEEENCPAFTVDLLLDASASRLHCQEVIAAQGVILAESLANCGIPVRVSAFSSLRGYTVLRVLKGFADKNRQNIFRYFASGWNRDGLALRAAGDLIRYAPGPAPRHLMILLTDASPNDSRRIPPTAQNPLGCAYEDAAGVADTAAQVRTLQRQGVRVSAVFMGEDSSAGAAAQIYGKNMARIRGMDQLARTAGRLIQNEIRELGD